MQPIDYKAIFARELHDMILEIFPAHGIDWISEDELVELVRDITRSEYDKSVAEFRRKQGISTLSGFRFRW